MLIRHSFIYLMARGLPGAINFIAIIVYTRMVSPDQYGQYSLFLAIVGIGEMVLFNWIRLGLLRYLPGFAEKEKTDFLSTIIVCFLFLVGLSIVLSMLSLFFFHDFNGVFLVVSLLCVQAFFDLNLELLRSNLSPIYYGILSMAKSLLSLLLGIVLILLGYKASGLMIGSIFGILIPLIFVLKKNWKSIHIKKFNKTYTQNLLNYGAPLTIIFAFSYVINISDRILLGWFKDVGDTGLYSVAYDLTQNTIILVMMVINLAAYPIIVKTLEKDGVEAALQQLKKSTTLLLMGATPITVVFISLAPNISTVILGEQFRHTANIIIPWVSLGVLLQGMKSYFLDLAFQLSKRTSMQIWPVSIAAVINVILNILWIPKWGITGSSIATLISYGVGFFVSWIVGRRIMPLNFSMSDFVKIVTSAIVMAFALYLISSWRGVSFLIFQVILGCIVYGVCLFALNVLNIRDYLTSSIKIKRRLFHGKNKHFLQK